MRYSPAQDDSLPRFERESWSTSQPLGRAPVLHVVFATLSKYPWVFCWGGGGWAVTKERFVCSFPKIIFFFFSPFKLRFLHFSSGFSSFRHEVSGSWSFPWVGWFSGRFWFCSRCLLEICGCLKHVQVESLHFFVEGFLGCWNDEHLVFFDYILL